MFEPIFSNKDSQQYGTRLLLMRISTAKTLTYNDLASEIGISGGTINRFLGKEIDVRKRTLVKILQYIEANKRELNYE